MDWILIRDVIFISLGCISAIGLAAYIGRYKSDN